MWRNTLTSVQLWRSSCSQRMTPGKSPNCSLPSFTWAMWSLRVRTDACTVDAILRCVKSLNHLSHWTHYSCVISGTIVNNLEACDIITSDHFNMVSQLLEVRVVFVFTTAYKWVEAWGWVRVSHRLRWLPKSWRSVWLSAPSWLPERVWPKSWPLPRLWTAGTPSSK